jgi:RNA recognition motif-containing protein
MTSPCEYPLYTLITAIMAAFLMGVLLGSRLRFRRGGSRVVRTTELYVGNLSARTNEQSIRKEFERFGEVRDVRLISGRSDDDRKPFAFLSMASVESAQAAANGMNGKEIDGQRVSVSEARSRRRRNGGGMRR